MKLKVKLQSYKLPALKQTPTTLSTLARNLLINYTGIAGDKVSSMCRFSVNLSAILENKCTFV